MTSVLIVDDSRTIRKVTRQILEQLNLSCTEAENGQHALEMFRTHNPELIILDWNMPVMNGIEFLEKLRAVPGGAAPIVIFSTTENDMEHIQRAMDAGANEYIMKPFNADIMKSKLAQVGIIALDEQA